MLLATANVAVSGRLHAEGEQHHAVLLRDLDGHDALVQGRWDGLYSGQTVLTATCAVLSVYCPFPGFLDHGKILLISRTGLYEYRSPWKTACTGASRNDEFAGRMFARSAMVARSCSSVTEVTPWSSQDPRGPRVSRVGDTCTHAHFVAIILKMFISGVWSPLELPRYLFYCHSYYF